MQGNEHTVGTSRGAAVGVVTKLVNVESTLSIGVVAGNVPGDGGGRALLGLFEGNRTGNLRVTAEDSNYSALLACNVPEFCQHL